MAHRLAPEVEVDLAGTWHCVAKESGSAQVAGRLIDSLTQRFVCAADISQGAGCAVNLLHSSVSLPAPIAQGSVAIE